MQKGADTQVDQSLCVFATLIENLPAQIEKSLRIFNPKLKDKYLFLYLHGRKLANLEHVLQRNVFSRRGSYKWFAFEYSSSCHFP